MKTAIVYYSKHHGNTKKLLDAIVAAADVDLIDVTAALIFPVMIGSGLLPAFTTAVLRSRSLHMRRKIFRMKSRYFSSIHMERRRAIS